MERIKFDYFLRFCKSKIVSKSVQINTMDDHVTTIIFDLV